MPSELIGTGALWIALAAALVVVLVQKPDAERMARAAPAALIVLAVQSLHFAEEFATGFHTKFPERLGLEPWTPAFFVWFNMGWIAVWTVAIAAAVMRRIPRMAAWPIWFLALAAIGNGIAHPGLAISAGDYFPGLFTSPVLGVAGLVLLRALMRRAR